MNKPSIEVKCECNIPFHHELVACLHKLLKGEMTDDQFPLEMPNREAISSATKRKMLFIKIMFKRPASVWRKRLVKTLSHILNKDLIATINGHDSVTLILL